MFNRLLSISSLGFCAIMPGQYPKCCGLHARFRSNPLASAGGLLVRAKSSYRGLMGDVILTKAARALVFFNSTMGTGPLAPWRWPRVRSPLQPSMVHCAGKQIIAPGQLIVCREFPPFLLLQPRKAILGRLFRFSTARGLAYLRRLKNLGGVADNSIAAWRGVKRYPRSRMHMPQ